jgi:hypothetical protein
MVIAHKSCSTSTVSVVKSKADEKLTHKSIRVKLFSRITNRRRERATKESNYAACFMEARLNCL